MLLDFLVQCIHRFNEPPTGADTVHMSNNLDATRLADLARDPHRHGDAATVAHAALRSAQAQRAVLVTAAQAIDARRRPAYELIAGASKARYALQDTRCPEYMQSQIVEARVALDNAEKALCAWHGQIDPERARRLMDEACGYLADE